MLWGNCRWWILMAPWTRHQELHRDRLNMCQAAGWVIDAPCHWWLTCVGKESLTGTASSARLASCGLWRIYLGDFWYSTLSFVIAIKKCPSTHWCRKKHRRPTKTCMDSWGKQVFLWIFSSKKIKDWKQQLDDNPKKNNDDNNNNNKTIKINTHSKTQPPSKSQASFAGRSSKGDRLCLRWCVDLAHRPAAVPWWSNIPIRPIDGKWW